MFLSKGAGAGPIVTQLGLVCAQTYALSARSKFTASRTVADELRQAGGIAADELRQAELLQTSYDRRNCCRRVTASGTATGELWQADIIITKTEYFDLFK